MSYLEPTPPEKLVDPQGRPYFLWDVDMTMDRFRDRLEHGDEAERAALLGKLMRQARPDDVFTFVTAARIREDWQRVEPYLGRTREFWRWLLDRWEALQVA